MRTDSLLPRLVLFVALALVALVALPAGDGPHAIAGDTDGDGGAGAGPEGSGGEDGEAEEETGDMWGGETSFSKEQVNKAISKGVSWLTRKQLPDGSWGEIGGGTFYGGGEDDGSRRGYPHPAGPTALALYTLLKCKVDPKNPVIRNGFKFIKENNYDKPGSSYEAAALLLAVCATANPSKRAASGKAGKIRLKGQYSKWAQDLVDHLVDKRRAGLRGWRYNQGSSESHGGDEDLSGTQLVALALFAAHRAGKKVRKKQIWEDILSYSLDQQLDEGVDHEIMDPADRSKQYKAKARGFAYIKGDEEGIHGKPYGSMTACGLANIEMARYVLSDGMSDKGAKAWHKRDDAAKVQKALYDGLAWLDLNWSPFKNPVPAQPKANVYHVYYLYSLERAMDLFDLNRVGSHLWYSEMGQELLNAQRDEGFWKTGSSLEPQDVLDTSFALLFLKRATAGTIPYGDFTGGGGQARDNR